MVKLKYKAYYSLEHYEVFISPLEGAMLTLDLRHPIAHSGPYQLRPDGTLNIEVLDWLSIHEDIDEKFIEIGEIVLNDVTHQRILDTLYEYSDDDELTINIRKAMIEKLREYYVSRFIR